MKESILSSISIDHCYEWNGESRPLRDWSLILGINLKTLYHRLEEGWSIDKAFSTPVKSRSATKYLTLPDGEQITTSALADRLGVPQSTVYSQVERGWSVERILGHQKLKKDRPTEMRATRLLTLEYEKLVKLLGILERDNKPPSSSWFDKLDACLDRIFDLKDSQSENPETIPALETNKRRKEHPLTMEEANALRELQRNRPMPINPNFDADRAQNNPDVDNRHS